MSAGSGSEGGSGGGGGSGGENQPQPPGAGAPEVATPGAPGAASLAAVSAEFALFDEFVGNLADSSVLARIEATVGPESTDRARAAVRTLSEIHAELRRVGGDRDGAERATLPASAPRGEAPAGVARAGAAPLRFVSAEFAPFEDFIDRVSSPEALATIGAALGPEAVARARAAAGALIDVSAELRLGVPAEVEALQQPVSRVSAEFAPFDAFIAALQPDAVGTVEEALGPEAANRARAAARALMDVSAELRMMSVESAPVEPAMRAALPPAAGGVPVAPEALRQLHDRAWISAEDSLVAIADMNIAAWTAAKRSIAAAAEISRGAISGFLSAELPFDR
jgi:hypothetical protein